MSQIRKVEICKLLYFLCKSAENISWMKFEGTCNLLNPFYQVVWCVVWCIRVSGVFQGVWVSGLYLNEIWWEHLAYEVHQGVWSGHIPALHLLCSLQRKNFIHLCHHTFLCTLALSEPAKKTTEKCKFPFLISLTSWTFAIVPLFKIIIGHLDNPLPPSPLPCLAKEKSQTFPPYFAKFFESSSLSELNYSVALRIGCKHFYGPLALLLFCPKLNC